ncbi:LysM peptidoglycan-binding domain-containing protein [Montanilutibacter psychrotolerans]|uniref:LysM peptidoglycan-binding domain-containing protein n=1 Tax=Montanilutibacter psychrotolerans TaxID=1327343 RepID=A0A3M8STF9_9GAMM|nr:LysM peptidoglycan-binding domain-containing protein [Lysobacter psychrotolerans]RNF84579.1 LysM peptidoglycan-binding domain-containing protein [Lysobacter psychrotolerans]
MLKPIRAVVTAALLTVATYGVAAEMSGNHPDTYVVKRGDTLWDIAGRFLKRPWLWPEIWQANPQIKNPHLIYPGDVISLAYLNRVAVEPGPRAEAPLNAIPLSDVEPFLKNLRVVDKVDDMPYVVGLEEDRLRSSEGQLVYVKGLPSAQPGQRYAVVRPTVRYTRVDRDECCDIHKADDLDFRGRRTINFEDFWTSRLVGENGTELLGFELMQQNVGTITRGEVGGIEASTLLLDRAGREVRIGDRLIPVEAQPYDLQFFPHPPKQQLEYGRARVLAVADTLTSGGPRDVIALSVGTRDGVDNGTVFSTWRVGSEPADRIRFGDSRSEDTIPRSGHVRLPDEYAGHVMIFKTFERVSYGLVMDSVKPTRVGYELKHPDAAY